MIQIKIVTNAQRKTIATDENNTVRAVLEANEINYASAPVYIDGSPLGVGDHDKTFAQLGITEKCMLTSVVKTENA
jgi:hypothetical protein